MLPFLVILAIVEKPLTQMCNYAFLSTTTFDIACWIRICESLARLDKGLPNPRLRVFDFMTLEISNKHCTLVESVLVCNVFGFLKLFGVFRRLDLQLLHEIFGYEVDL